MEKIVSVAEAVGCKVTRNADMSKLTTFKVGGSAELVVEPDRSKADSAR